MNIAIFGTGSVGGRLGGLLLSAGHAVVFGSRRPDTAHANLPAGATVASFADAAASAEVVLLATPWAGENGRATLDLLASLAPSLSGRIVIDATNPLNPDWSPAPLGPDTSGGEEVARALPGARVVKAFNTVFADVMDADSLAAFGTRPTLFFCGDDAPAKATVADLTSGIGFAPLDCGPLSGARYLEAMAHLNIRIAVGQGGGTRAAFVYARL